MNVVDAFARCRSPADFYRLQIEIENGFSPAEMAALIARKDELAPRVHAWLGWLETMMRIGSPTIRPFERTTLAEHVRLYRGDGRPVSARSLIVAFCGNSERLMLPLPGFLQHVPARRFDVVVLSDPTQALYLRGVQGYAADIAGVARRLSQELPLEQYAALRCIGTSGGGAAALFCAQMLEAEHAVAVGGGHPSLAREHLAPMGLDGHEMDRMRRAGEPRATRMLCCFAADNARDRDGAQSLREIFPQAQPHPVAGIASHNVIYELLKRRELRQFLDAVLFGPREPSARRSEAA